jgi:signal transduction histidine kinase
MAAPRSGSPTRLRSTLDRVLVHDVKNMSFRLRLLLSNLEEHWDDPEFRATVRNLLASTVERLEDIAGRFVAHEDAVLIKVALEINDLVRECARRPPRRGGRDGVKPPSISLALGETPRIWGDPYYVGDAIATLIENASEAAAPGGKVLVRTYAAGGSRKPRAVVEVIDNGAGMSAEFLKDRLFRAFETTKSGGVGLGLATAQQIVRFHRGSMRVLSQSGGGTLIRLSFPGIAEAPPPDDGRREPS